MRIQYKIVLGLFLFNAFLTLFTPIFSEAVDTDIGGHAINYTESDLAQFDPKVGIADMMVAMFVGKTDAWSSIATIVAFAGLNVIVFAWCLINKNYVPIGVSLFVSIVISLYIRLSTVIAGINTSHGNYIISGIISIVGIAIGIIIMFSVVDMFAPASARQ